MNNACDRPKVALVAPVPEDRGLTGALFGILREIAPDFNVSQRWIQPAVGPVNQLNPEPRRRLVDCSISPTRSSEPGPDPETMWLVALITG